ncbi:MAG: SurA N-terminal domain-containing protein, partial [Alphaproteobacteria bacterium]|nr:SurA N-terminal domain-containing protein [Alphaproteobacteria bacterium]
MKSSMWRRFNIFALSVALTVGCIAGVNSPKAAHAQMSIVAVVNDDMVSSLDVEQRIRFTLATTGLSDSAEVRARLRPEIIRQLIDERLQMQEAARLGIVVTQYEIEGAFANVNQQRGLPAGSFQQFLASRVVSSDKVEDQMRAQIGWSKVVLQSLRKKVRVSEDEVQRER